MDVVFLRHIQEQKNEFGVYCKVEEWEKIFPNITLSENSM